jgi:hypothetical protein
MVECGGMPKQFGCARSYESFTGRNDCKLLSEGIRLLVVVKWAFGFLCRITAS